MPKVNPIGPRAGFNDETATYEDVNPHLTEFLRQQEGERIIVKAMPIHQIEPDAVQPRRAVPSAVRGERVPPSASDPTRWRLAHWMRLAWREHEGGDPANLDTMRDLFSRMIAGEEVDDSGAALIDNPGPILGALLKVVELAASIRRDGLTNPITVSRFADKYVIETGERRWWAFHLLHDLTGDEKYAKIPAREVERIDVWRQANENNQRDQLNAVGKARQYAILLMDLILSIDPVRGKYLQPFETFEQEQDYYRQAAALRVPYGKGDEIANAMGLKNRSSLSEYKALLTLPNEYWVRGDDEEWAIHDLLQIVRASNNSADESTSPPAPSPQTGAGKISQPVGQLGNQPPAPTLPPHPQPLSHAGRGETTPGAVQQKLQFRPGQPVWTTMGEGEIVKAIGPNLYEVRVNGKTRAFKLDQLSAEKPREAAPRVQQGDYVRTPAGHVGYVVADNDSRMVDVRTINGVRSYARETLMKIATPASGYIEVNGRKVDLTTGEIVEDAPEEPETLDIEMNRTPWQIVRDGASFVVADAAGYPIANCGENEEAADWIVDMTNLFGEGEYMTAMAHIVQFALDRETVHPGLIADIDLIYGLLGEIESEAKFAVGHLGEETGEEAENA